PDRTAYHCRFSVKKKVIVEADHELGFGRLLRCPKTTFLPSTHPNSCKASEKPSLRWVFATCAEHAYWPARRERPCRRADEARDELAPSYIEHGASPPPPARRGWPMQSLCRILRLNGAFGTSLGQT